MLIRKTVEIALEKGLIKQKATIIVDTTHTKSRYNQKGQVEVLKEQSNRLRKSVYAIDKSVKEIFPQKPKESDIDAVMSYCNKLVVLSLKCTFLEMA